MVTMAEAERAAPRTRMRAEDRREHFLQVTAELIAERGVEAVTMEAVAAAAGVSKGLGYAYYENRNDLLLAVIEREMGALDARVGAALASAEGFEESIRAAVRAWMDVLKERGALLRELLQADLPAGPLEQRRADTFRRAQDFFGDMAAAEFGVPPRKARVVAAVMLAGLRGIVDRWRAGDNRKLLEDTFVQFLVEGFKGMARSDTGEGA